MLIHFKFCFENVPIDSTPAKMLRYYRKRRGFTIRQLAEQAGIVSATLLKYENDRFPISYHAGIAFAEFLQIDRELLLDDFSLFLDYPYSVRLREVRKAYGLNQTEFAIKADISQSIYAKWESATRQPSRKMYEQLAATYPEIKI